MGEFRDLILTLLIALFVVATLDIFVIYGGLHLG